MRVSGQNGNLGAPPFSPLRREGGRVGAPPFDSAQGIPFSPLRREGGRVGAPPFDSAQGIPFSPPLREGGNRRPRRQIEFCFEKRFPGRTLTGRAGKKARGQGRQAPAKTGRTAHRSSAVRVTGACNAQLYDDPSPRSLSSTSKTRLRWLRKYNTPDCTFVT